MSRGHRTYLDWNATAPLRPEAREAMTAALDVVGNPSSVHAEGRRARAIIETAREQVAAVVGADPAQIYFTSGASEANSWVVRSGWDSVLLAPVEHDSVRAPAAASGARVIDLAVAPDGRVAVEGIASEALKGSGPLGRALVAVQWANNETGVLQPVAETVALAAAQGICVLVDAVQVVGRLNVDFNQTGMDYLTISGHKLGGPKGVGVLIARDGAHLAPLIIGGGQERRQRAGTENVAAIAGLGAAMVAARRDLEQAWSDMAARRDRLEREILALTPSAVVVGCGAPRLSNTTCLSLPGRRAEVLVAVLDLAGIAVSAGAACSSGKVSASATLAAMALPREVIDGAIRVSQGPSTTDEDIAAFLAAWSNFSTTSQRAA
ncbi:MAG: cysteine desulfurase family protein [Hyphomicrobiaceae bacterium]|nr:cysteine desulfurase family protein [Hyphomicrobiaceae bacterium]